MRILYIADSTSIHTQRWLGYFRDIGHEISIITLGVKRETIPGIKHLANFRQFYYGDIFSLYVLLRTRNIVHREKPDILHGHFVHQYGWLAAMSGYHPLVITAWGSDILSLPDASRLRMGKYFTSYAVRKADLLTATSAHARSELIKLGAPPSNTHVIFWGVDKDRFAEAETLRKELAIKPGQKVILSNRNQSELYNNDVVMRAFANVIRAFPEAILILQNSGGNLEPELKVLARKLGIGASVRFLPQLPHNATPALYALADVYVSVPSWDAGPVSLKEAMMAGAAPVISDLPGPREWVEHGFNGIIVPVRDVHKLGQEIISLLGDENRRREYAAKNRKLIAEKADHKYQMMKMEALYQTLYSQIFPSKINRNW